MPKIRDYDCTCGSRFESMTMTDSDVVTCPDCGSNDVAAAVTGGVPLSTIVPMSNSSLKNKAGYVHTHGDKPGKGNMVAVPGNKGSF